MTGTRPPIVLSAPTALVIVEAPEHWESFHRIRRTVLWEARGRFDYDETHPDDYLASNIPLLLFSGPTAVATVRLDLLDDATTAAFRRLAVVPERERQGYGRTLMEKAEAMAMERGRRFFTATVAKSAVPFWEKIGYGPANAAAAGENENPVMVKRG